MPSSNISNSHISHFNISDMIYSNSSLSCTHEFHFLLHHYSCSTMSFLLPGWLYGFCLGFLLSIIQGSPFVSLLWEFLRILQPIASYNVICFFNSWSYESACGWKVALLFHCFIINSNLSDSLAGYKFLSWKLFSLSNAILYCHLISGLESWEVWNPIWSQILWKVWYSIFVLSPQKCNDKLPLSEFTVALRIGRALQVEAIKSKKSSCLTVIYGRNIS